MSTDNGSQHLARPFRVLFVAGADRSGSTLLDLLLGAAEGVVSVGELRHLWRRGLLENQLCGCGAPFQSCPFWSEVGRVAFGGWQAIDVEEVVALQRRVDRFRNLPALALRGAGRGETARYAGLISDIYAAIARVSGADVVVDSSKAPSYTLILASVTPRPHVVHLVRDSRAVAYSWRRVKRRPELGGEAMPRHGAGYVSAVWLAHNGAIHLTRRVGLERTLLRYEDLVSDPMAAVERLQPALGPVASQVRATLQGAEVHAGVNHTVSGNPVRFGGRTIEIRPDEAWRTDLARAPRRAVEGLTWPLLLAYGYPIRADDGSG